MVVEMEKEGVFMGGGVGLDMGGFDRVVKVRNGKGGE